MLSQIPRGPRTASKNGYFGHLRTVSDRLPSNFTVNFNHHTGEESASNSPGIFIKKAARKQPVQDPVGRIFNRAHLDTDRAPRDYFLPIFVNIYNRFLTVSTGAARLPFGGPTDP